RVDPDWVGEVRDQCVAASVPFFFKQWGGRTPKSGGRLLDGRTWDEMPAGLATFLVAELQQPSRISGVIRRKRAQERRRESEATQGRRAPRPTRQRMPDRTPIRTGSTSTILARAAAALGTDRPGADNGRGTGMAFDRHA